MKCSLRAIWKNSLIFVSVALAALTTKNALADADLGTFLKEDLGLSGSIRGSFFSKDLSFNDDRGFAVGSIWLTANPKPVLGMTAYFDGRVQGQNLIRNFDWNWELREGYAQGANGDFDFKIGRQITVWGRADKVNPTDVWTSRDYTLLTTDDEDQRLGIFSTQVIWNQPDFRVIGIWQPEWRSPVFPIAPLPPGVTVQYLEPVEVAPQWGVKLDHSGGDMDWSLSYSHVVDRTPDFSILSAGPNGVQLGFLFQRIDVVGADAAFNFESYGLRGEIAYTMTQDHGGTDPLTQNNNLFAVIGIDRTFEGVLSINTQYLYRKTFDFQDPSSISNPNLRFLAQQENLVSDQLAGDMHGASLRIDHKAWNETLETEVAAVVWFTKGDSLIQPKISYAFSDHFKGIVGARFFSGPTDSFFGRLHDATTGFVEARVFY